MQPQAYHDEFMECAKPRDFREDLLRYLPRSARDKVRILDVAAGPLSCLGNRLQPHTLDITAVDVLAAEYNELLAEARIDPPVKTSLCEAEQIHKKFPANSFDLAFIRNALDHCYDPMTVIRNVYFVLKPGGFFVIEGFINQAEFENYGGLHQWNIDYQENQLVISSKTSMFEIPRGLDLPFDLSVPIYNPGSRWIKAVLHKGDEAMRAA